MFHRIGLFDEAFDACEDVEFNERVHAAGLTCYFTPSVKIVYEPRASFGTLFYQLSRYGLGRARLAFKHPRSLSLPALVQTLGKRDVQGVLIEGGPTLAWAAIRDGIVDQVVLYQAPILVGGRSAKGWLEGAGFAPIDRAAHLEIVSVERVDDGLKVVADVHRDR